MCMAPKKTQQPHVPCKQCGECGEGIDVEAIVDGARALGWPVGEGDCEHANEDGSCCGSCADLAQSMEEDDPQATYEADNGIPDSAPFMDEEKP